MAEPIAQGQDDSTELAEVHDRRIGRLEGIAEQLDRRLDGIERAISELRGAVRWLIGIQFGIVGLLVSTLLKLNG